MSKFAFLLLSATFLVAHGPAASGADLIYTLSGGTLTGTLNGVDFTDATYLVTAIGDSTNVVYSAGPPESYTLVLTPTIEIEGFSPVTITEANFGVYSFEVGGFSGSGFAVVDTLEGFGNLVESSDNFITLAALASVTGQLTFTDGQFLSTSGGSLIFTAASGDSTFTVTAVPEPASLGLAALASCTLLAIGRKGRRKSLAAR